MLAGRKSGQSMVHGHHRIAGALDNDLDRWMCDVRDSVIAWTGQAGLVGCIPGCSVKLFRGPGRPQHAQPGTWHVQIDDAEHVYPRNAQRLRNAIRGRDRKVTSATVEGA